MGAAADPQLQWTSQAVIISVWASVKDSGQTMNLSGLPISVSQDIAIDELSNELPYSYTPIFLHSSYLRSVKELCLSSPFILSFEFGVIQS